MKKLPEPFCVKMVESVYFKRLEQRQQVRFILVSVSK